jgi:hypothetical protein
MNRSSRILAAVALAACSVDADDGFTGVASGGASAGTPTSSASGISAGNSTADDGSAEGTASGGPSDATGEATSASGGSGSTSAGEGPGSSSAGDVSDSGAGVCDGAALDAQLEVPPLCAPTCTSFGFSNDCPALNVCRLKDSATGVCESCQPCGNLEAPCSASSECDILFTCFKGQCTAMCDLTTPQTCGNPAACTDVGHPTHGVCDPAL